MSILPLSTTDTPTILLLTATITPAANASANLAVLDPDQRRQQYARALSDYARAYGRGVDGIVLVENSGADLSLLEHAVPAHVPHEFLNLTAEQSTGYVRRGYLETSMVVRAFDHSTLLQQPGATAVKATGRYLTHNLPAVLGAMDARCDLGFNLRRYPKPWADMWLYFLNRRGATTLAGRLEELGRVAPGGSAELSMYEIATDLHRQGYPIQLRYAVEPKLTGARGSDGAAYESWTQRTKWVARSLSKRLAPSVWV